LATWHEQGLPKEKGLDDYHDHLWDILDIAFDRPSQEVVDPGIDFLMVPKFEERVLKHEDGHSIVQDWKGNICEISDELDVTDIRTAIDFVTRKWIKCPVEDRDDWEQMKERYDSGDPDRFPEDFEDRAKKLKERDYVVTLGISGPFWQLREWLGFEELCLLLVEQPDWVAEMAEFYQDFVSKMLNRVLEHFVPDDICISEDMAYKAKAMISPAMIREICSPAWRAWTKQAKDAGVPIVSVDSDGYVGELIPLWIEAGINCNHPVEVAAHCDINDFRGRFGHLMAYRDGIDKRCIAQGGQSLIDELERVEPVMRDGGYIPCCDHAVPPDISWPNFVEYARLLAKMTGWL